MKEIAGVQDQIGPECDDAADALVPGVVKVLLALIEPCAR